MFFLSFFNEFNNQEYKESNSTAKSIFVCYIYRFKWTMLKSVQAVDPHYDINKS